MDITRVYVLHHLKKNGFDIAKPPYSYIQLTELERKWFDMAMECFYTDLETPSGVELSALLDTCSIRSEEYLKETMTGVLDLIENTKNKSVITLCFLSAVCLALHKAGKDSGFIVEHIIRDNYLRRVTRRFHGLLVTLGLRDGL